MKREGDDMVLAQIFERAGRTTMRARGAIAACVILHAASGCAWFAAQPEIDPDRWAPPQETREWQLQDASDSRVLTESANALPHPTQTGGGRYDLITLCELALRDSPQTRRAWESARTAAAQLGKTRSYYYPTISTETDGGYTREFFPSPGRYGLVKQWYINPQVSLEYTLLDFGRRAADTETATEQLIAANLSFNRAMQNVIFAVQRSFYALAAAEASVIAAEQNLTLARTNLEAVDQRVSVGLATQPALLLAKQVAAQSIYDLENARVLVREAQADIAVAVGVPANSAIAVQSLQAQAVPDGLGKEVNDLIDSAVRQRPDLAAQLANFRSSQSTVRRAQAEWYPVLGVDGSYGETNFGFSWNNESTLKGNTPVYSALLSLRWDLFTGFERLNAIREASAESRAARADLDSAELDTIGQVWKSYYEFQSAMKKYQYAQALLAASQEAYDANIETYRQGLSTIVELLTADRDLANARYTLIQSKADLLISSAAVAYSTGAVAMPVSKP
ncbi:MAG TPA: TolC family protein [Candidatus Binataceae bacterium]